MKSSDPWNVRPTDFPYEGNSIDKLRFLLNYAVLAPSSHNTQPWLFRLHGDAVDLIADRIRALPVIDPHDRELFISCGAAIGMMCFAAKAFGYEAVVALLPKPTEPDLLATIGLRQSHRATSTDIALFQAITRRRTTRVRFETRPIPTEVIAAMQEAAAQDWVTLRIFTTEAERAKMAALIAEADRLQFADPSFRREHAAWMHSRHALSRDGMSLASMGVPDILTPLSALALRTFDVGDGRAAASEEIAKLTPALAVMATDRDCPEDWLLAGRAMARTLLTATSAGLASGYLNQPIEVPALRLRLAELVSPRIRSIRSSSCGSVMDPIFRPHPDAGSAR